MPDYNRPTIDLYRYWDDKGALLYVGISLNAAARASQHAKDKTWWPEVARITIQHLGPVDRAEAESIEAAAITVENPKYNIRHNMGKKPEPKVVDNSWVLDDGKALEMYGQIFDKMEQLVFHVGKQKSLNAPGVPSCEDVGKMFAEIFTLVLWAQSCPRCRLADRGYRSLPIKLHTGEGRTSLLSLCTACMKTHKGTTNDR
jgi:hypothetical protein